MILVLRTDTMTAFLGLLSPVGEILKRQEWEAGRQLSVQLPGAIDEILGSADINYKDISGIVVYEGPGSFTGLRIGITILNTMAHELKIPIAGSTGEEWIEVGLDKLKETKSGTIVMPVYGGEANITKPKK
jgi:tRNA threonylcarbamoyladenosine biosynthesis protein TsaB